MSDPFADLATSRVLPVLTVSDADEAVRACRALAAGGLRTVEITFRSAAAVDAIRRVSAMGDLVVGAGTVLSRAQLDRAVDAGARFAVSPATNPDVVEAARHAEVAFVPGVATSSEIERARTLGCRVVKVFPASLVGGPDFVRAISAVYPDVRVVPTGGIGVRNLASYLALPAVLACGGSWVCEQSLLDERRYDEIERRAHEAVAIATAAVVP